MQQQQQLGLLPNPISFQSGLVLQSSTASGVPPFTFTTGELDALHQKLQNAANQILIGPNRNSAMFPISVNEIQTLLRMIDMTYVQGLSGCAIPQQTPQTLAMRGFNQSNNRPPPPNYVCHKCHVPGHYIQDCPMQISINRPPANYVCKKCNTPGHWIQECPLKTNAKHDYTKNPEGDYICDRCGIAGHWIKHCPTNGNPSFNNKPHQDENKTKKRLYNEMIQSQQPQQPQQSQPSNQPQSQQPTQSLQSQQVNTNNNNLNNNNNNSNPTNPSNQNPVNASKAIPNQNQNEPVAKSADNQENDVAFAQPPSKKRKLNLD